MFYPVTLGVEVHSFTKMFEISYRWDFGHNVIVVSESPRVSTNRDIVDNVFVHTLWRTKRVESYVFIVESDRTYSRQRGTQ